MPNWVQFNVWQGNSPFSYNRECFTICPSHFQTSITLVMVYHSLHKLCHMIKCCCIHYLTICIKFSRWTITYMSYKGRGIRRSRALLFEYFCLISKLVKWSGLFRRPVQGLAFLGLMVFYPCLTRKSLLYSRLS